MAQPDRRIDPRFVSQFAVLREAAKRIGGIDLGFGYSSTGAQTDAPDYIYEDKVLLVPTHRADEIIGRNPLRNTEVDPVRNVRSRRNSLTDVSVLNLDHEEVPTAVQRFAEMDGVGPGVVTPNHVISICSGFSNICPGCEPTPASGQPVPDAAAGDAGAGVRVEVVDTGVWDGYRSYPWFANVRGHTATGADGKPLNMAVLGREEVADPIPEAWKGDPLGPDGIREYQGHGVFVAGVLRCVAPGVDVHVSNALTLVGAATEVEFGQYLVDGVMGAEAGQPDIINLSAGSASVDGRVHQGLRAFLDELLAPDCRTLLVAAAGNDGLDRPFYPAAFAPEANGAIVSVGALREDGKGRACFSNFGDWVDVFAPGENLVNAFPTGRYQYVDPKAAGCHTYPPHRYQCTCLAAADAGTEVSFRRYAKWSGTSFAAPYVAGLVAARISATGESPREAAATLLRDAGRRLDLTGIVQGQPYEPSSLDQFRVLP